MINYTIRITEEEGNPVAWIDANGSVCIKQPHAPGITSPWNSVAEAQSWAEAHVTELEQYNQAAEAAAQAAEEKASADSKRLEEIHAMLKSLTGM
jgi:hypothetical protein